MKAGGIFFASSKLDAELSARRLLGANIHDELVSNILIEEKISSKRELYVGISVNREKRCYLLLASTHGGSDIEEVATRDPSKIVRKNLDPLTGLSQSGAETIGRTLGYSEDRLQTLASALVRLHEVTMAYDAELVEANPMIETPTGQFVLADQGDY
jgi:succinyl-CoA synthetase beta subunit